MWNFKGCYAFLVMAIISSAEGILVAGPKFIRANQNYMMVISHYKTDLHKVDLLVRLEGQSDEGENLLNDTKMVTVRRHMNQKVEFSMPGNLVPGRYKVTVDGQQGFNFHKEAHLEFLKKSIAGLIQISQPVFKPGDNVKFRVIMLDTELKPLSWFESFNVTIRDSQQNVIREWASTNLYAGVFESDLQIALTPSFGIWNIVVQMEGIEVVSKTFEVKEYLLSTFDLQVTPSVIPLEEHHALNLTIASYYHYGKPVQGLAIIELYLEDDKLDQKKELEVYGRGQIELRFVGSLELHNDHQDVRVKVLFIEQFTNHTVTKKEPITVFKYPYRVELMKEYPQFFPGYIFECVLKFTYHDGTPASGISGVVKMNDVVQQSANSSDSNGLIKLELQPSAETEIMNISFTNDALRFCFHETVAKKIEKVPFKLELESPVKIKNVLNLFVRHFVRMTFFVYYVVSKGNIVDAGFIRPNMLRRFHLNINVTTKMLPKATIILASIANQTLVYDFVNIDFQQHQNYFDLSIDENEVEPGRGIELSISGPPGAYVGLAAYEKSLLTFGKHHDLFWEDIEQVFDGFHHVSENEFDSFQNTGLFVKALDEITVKAVNKRTPRKRHEIDNFFDKSVCHLHFENPWLWRSVTIEWDGRLKLMEIVPNTTSFWYLTGFSIDPVYGFGIVKKPLQFRTVKPDW